MTAGPELSYVEQPFLEQLASMGWKIVTGSADHALVTGREGFRDGCATLGVLRGSGCR